MTHLRALLAAIVLSATCACLAASALAADTGHPPARAVAPVARTAHAGTAHHRPGHAHRASCRGARKHHRKHLRRCRTLTRAIHGGRSHREGGARARSGKHSPLPHTGRVHAGGNRTSELAPTQTVSAAPLAATIANVLATPCQNTELMPEAGNLEAIRTATLCLVNQERARNDELPLRVNARLQAAAQKHSDEMVGEDYFAHVAPNGETPFTRVQNTGYIPNSQVGYTIGENIAWGTLYLATPSSIVAAWNASPEHLANILDGAYRDTAIGIAAAAPPSLAEGQPGAMYTQEFGVIRD